MQGTNYIVEAPVFDYSTQNHQFWNSDERQFWAKFRSHLVDAPYLMVLQSRNNVKLSSLAVIQNQQNLKRIKQGVVNDVVSANQNFTAAANNYQAMLVKPRGTETESSFFTEAIRSWTSWFFRGSTSQKF